MNKLCSDLDAFKKVQRTSLKRGFHIFGDHKHSCADTQPGHASARVRDMNHMYQVNEAHLEIVVLYVHSLECLLEAFIENEVLLMVKKAQKLLNFWTMRGSERECKIF